MTINAKHEHLIQPELLDIQAINEWLRKHFHCNSCYVQQMTELNLLCQGCPYYNASSRPLKKGEKKQRCRVGFRPSISKQFGFLNDCHVGRTDIVYLHQKFPTVWKMPELPDISLFGQQTTWWEKHHYESPWNDNLVVRTTEREHKTLDALKRKGDSFFIYILNRTREIDPSLEPGQLLTLEELKDYHAQFKKIEDNKYILKKDSILFQLQEKCLRKLKEKFPDISF